MKSSVRCCLIGICLSLAAGSLASANDMDEAFFEKKIRPILAETCFRCHGGQKISSQLRVDSAEALSKGGESGPALVAGEPAESLLLKAIHRDEDVSAMPPDKPLPRKVVADIEAWTKAGAKWPAKFTEFRSERHWAFAPPKAIAPPKAFAPPKEFAPPKAFAPSGFAAHPIDGFLAADKNRADKRTLIRRVTFDLIGLPPTPDEVADYLADDSPDAFERVVDRLLASPHHREKWARHWLDVVRYADTAGETADFPALTPGGIATTSSTPSTVTSRMTSSSANRSRAICSRDKATNVTPNSSRRPDTSESRFGLGSISAPITF